MKKSIIFLAFFGIALVFAQKITTLAEYKSSIKANKAEAKKELSPFLYDGYKTTYFNYKTYKQTKELEIYLFNNTEYKLVINSKASSKGIDVKIYDKDKTSEDRVLLKTINKAENQNLVVNTNELNKVLKTANAKATRLKRIFISYEIPAVSTANNTKPLIEDRAAVILVMGYKND
jgi:hypothetical protein